MAADCWACATSIGRLQNPRGQAHDPLGTCRNCHALACGHHGHRDPNVPEYICVECDPQLLIASALPSGAAALPVPAVPSYHPPVGIPDEIWRIHSIADFHERRPGYGEGILDEAFRRPLNTRRLAPYLARTLDARPEGLQLLTLAGLIALRMEIPVQQLTPFLRDLRASMLSE